MSTTPNLAVSIDPNNNRRIIVEGVRVAFADGLNKASEQENDDGTKRRNFGAAFIAEIANPGMQAFYQGFNQAMFNAATAKWGEKAAAMFQQLQAQNRLALHNGAEKADKEGFGAEVYFFNASAREEEPPILLNNYLDPAGTGPQVLQRPQRRIYSGCYVKVQIDLWAQDNPKGGKRINASVKVVQFQADGESFGGGVPADTSAFGGVPAPAGAMAMSAPAAPSFGAPAAPSFGAPAAPSFGAPAAPAGGPSFGAPAAPAGAPSFGAPPVAAPAFAAPAAAPNQAAAPAFAAPSFGAPAAGGGPAFGIPASNVPY